MPRRPPASSISTRGPSARTTTGTHSCPASRPGQLYALPRRWAVRSGPADIVSTATRCCSIPYGKCVARPAGLEPRGGARAWRQLRLGIEERGRRLRARTTGRATVRCTRPLPGRWSTRCTWAPSRGTPTPASRRRRRGTYHGVIDKIPYLQDLGITAVELLPVFAFDDQDAPGGVNDWGYQPVSFFAPHAGIQLAARPARRARRVPGHGQGAAPRRHRGHPRRGLQPHHRGRRGRSDAVLPRFRQRHLLHPRRQPRRRTPTTAAAATR